MLLCCCRYWTMDRSLQRRLQKTNYQHIKRLCRDRGQLFEDVDFPPVGRSLFKSKKPGLHPIVWLRPHVRTTALFRMSVCLSVINTPTSPFEPIRNCLHSWSHIDYLSLSYIHRNWSLWSVIVFSVLITGLITLVSSEVLESSRFLLALIKYRRFANGPSS